LIRELLAGRKAWLFWGSDDHAKSTAALYSLVASARLHQLDVEEYLRCLIDGQICLAGPGVCGNTRRNQATIDAVEAAYAATNGIVKLRFGMYADPNDAPLEVRAWADDLCVGPE
jgi:hypothetical protein